MKILLNLFASFYDAHFICLQVCDRIIDSGRVLARSQKSSSPLMYEWHDKKYLGAAHGLVGILHTLLMACTSLFILSMWLHYALNNYQDTQYIVFGCGFYLVLAYVLF